MRTRNELAVAIANALKNTGRMIETDKIEIVAIENKLGSDYATVIVQLTKKRCRKPYIAWTLMIDMARELIYFERSVFVYL